jgi:hypothetical protein
VTTSQGRPPTGRCPRAHAGCPAHRCTGVEAAGAEVAGVEVLSRHRSAEGEVRYLRCGCGAVTLTVGGEPVARVPPGLAALARRLAGSRPAAGPTRGVIGGEAG